MSAGDFGGLVGAMLIGRIGAAVASTCEGQKQNDGKYNEDQKERA